MTTQQPFEDRVRQDFTEWENTRHPEPDEARAKLHARIDHDFTNHAPIAAEIIERFEIARSWAKGFGHFIIDGTPAGREQQIALTKLEECLAATVAAIARNQAAILDNS